MQADTTPDTAQLHTISREAFWHHHIDQWRSSGLSKIAYCREHTLPYSQMVYWSTKDVSAAEPERASGGFFAVSVSSSVSNSGLSVKLPSGVTIQGINDRTVDLVGKLIAQL